MKNYFFVGHHGCGKTCGAKLLFKKGCLHRYFDTGPIIRSQCAKNSILPLSDWIETNGKIFGEYFTDDVIYEVVKEELLREADSYSKIAVVGYRTLSGLKYFADRLEKDFSCQSTIVFVEIDKEKACDGYNRREGLDLSIEKYSHMRDSQIVKLEEIKKVADLVIFNNRSIDSLLRELIQIVWGDLMI